jgi:hypothetical protein
MSACGSPEPQSPPAETPQTQQQAPAQTAEAAPDSLQPVQQADSSLQTPEPAASAAQPGQNRPAQTNMADTSNQSQQPPPAAPAEPAMAPHTIRVTASVLACREENNGYIATITIQKVHAYGASTPPLATGNEIAVRIMKSVDQAARFTQQGGTLELTMRHQTPLAAVQPPPPAWQVMKVH